MPVGAAGSPAEAGGRVPSDGERLAGVETIAGEVDLARLPMALDDVEHGGELVTTHRALFPVAGRLRLSAK